MRADFYSIVISSALVFVANCFNLGRGWKNFEQGLLEAENNERSWKFLPLFSIVKIVNVPCVPESTENDAAVCYTNSQCRNAGGVASGSCSNGFGVCCVVTATCESIVNHNNTNFRNREEHGEPFNPTSLQVCNVRIQRPSPSICQLRLDFVTMQLATADPTAGQCMVDRLSINGVADAVPPNLCGDLGGQHMYLDYGSSDRITLSAITDGAVDSITPRQFHVVIRYIECNSLSRAPQGCLQFFTSGTTGKVRILGYPMVPHLADLDYTACVRSEDGVGSIVWSPCPSEPIAQAFLLTGSPLINASDGANPGDSCSTDYVLIMSDVSTNDRATDRYCGNALNYDTAPWFVRSVAKPFIMRVRTDSNEDQDTANTGFCLTFRQEPPRPQAG